MSESAGPLPDLELKLLSFSLLRFTMCVFLKKAEYGEDFFHSLALFTLKEKFLGAQCACEDLKPRGLYLGARPLQDSSQVETLIQVDQG